MKIVLDTNSIQDYRRFLAIKQLPVWQFRGRQAEFPDEYAERLGLSAQACRGIPWVPSSFLFDYQREITSICLEKQKYALFVDCGLGKTLVFLEFVQAVGQHLGSTRGSLIVSPLMVVPQTLAEARRWYPKLEIEHVRAAQLKDWLQSCGGKIGITNYEAIRDDLKAGQLGCLVLDESSMLKSHYGKWGTKLIELGRGLDWKLACTGTPAPNDRIEYGNHAVFLDQFPNVNSFLATYFINRGQTQERWALKDHAIEPFYRQLSHWAIFMSHPSTYGWKDNCDNIPPINVHIHQVPLTGDQRAAFHAETGDLFAANTGGITRRGKLGQIAKGRWNGAAIKTNKPEFIHNLVGSWPNESTIIWCIYNEEQASIEKMFPDAASIAGDTPADKRLELIDDFKLGRRKVLISKPKILGFGLNLQIATRQVFSGLQDSYESYYQAVKRSNRYGSTLPLNVHIPVTDLEEPMVQNVLRKAALIEEDTAAQERMFRHAIHA